MANVEAQAKSDEKSKRGVPVSMFLIVVLLLIVAGGAGFFVLARQVTPAPVAAAPVTEPVVVGPVVRLEPIFINLRGERFLKLGLALQTTEQGEGESVDGAMALDAAIEVFSDQDMTQLSSNERRAALKEELVKRVTEGYGPAVSNIYFTEFVMQ